MPNNPVDIYVGLRLRDRRILMGLSQNKMGNLIGVTFQQIQKYEKGVNRIGSSRLYQISQILLIPVGYFFEGYEENKEIDIIDDNKARAICGLINFAKTLSTKKITVLKSIAKLMMEE